MISGDGLKLDAPALAEEDDAAPFARSADGHGARGIVGGAIHGALHAVSAGQLAHLGDVIGTAAQHFVAQAQVAREFHALLQHVDADDPVRAQFAAERAGGESHGSQAR